MRLLVCGGREYGDADRVLREIAALSPTVICHGKARGADTLAGAAAKLLSIPCDEFPANWRLHGVKAGYIRNAQMLRDFKPDQVLAFPGGPGTKMMCTLATKAGVPVTLIK
jgi:hypothetical protein